jgi:hypothetical protein
MESSAPRHRPRGERSEGVSEKHFRSVHVCSFSSADHLLGRKRTYAAVREAVLKAGRYSVFEASESKANAALFTRLDKDPTLERYELGFPWIGVRIRDRLPEPAAQEESK